jgi:hypothetical protein
LLKCRASDEAPTHLFMKIENPIAFNFIMQDEIYLLAKDKIFYTDKVEPESATVLPLETPAPIFNYVGQNKTQFLVIVHYPDADFMAGQHLAALESTLKRLGLALADVAIVNRATYAAATFHQLSDFFAPQKLLILGHNALPEGMEPLSFNKTVKLSNCHTLFTYSFNEMMESNDHKKAFWEQMKQL